MTTESYSEVNVFLLVLSVRCLRVVLVCLMSADPDNYYHSLKLQMRGSHLSPSNLQPLRLLSPNTGLPVVAGRNTHVTFLERGLLHLLPNEFLTPDWHFWQM